MTTSFRVTLTITRPEKLFFFAPDKKTLQGQTWLPPHTHTQVPTTYFWYLLKRFLSHAKKVDC